MRLSVPESMIAQVSVGQNHDVSIAADAKSRSATVVQIAAEPNARQAYPVTLTIEGEERIRAGMMAEGALSLPAAAHTARAVVVPITALRAEADDLHVVFTFDPERSVVRERKIEVQRLDDDPATIAGVEAGTIVADRGVAFLHDGQPVHRLGVGARQFEAEVRR